MIRVDTLLQKIALLIFSNLQKILMGKIRFFPKRNTYDLILFTKIQLLIFLFQKTSRILNLFVNDRKLRPIDKSKFLQKKMGTYFFRIYPPKYTMRYFVFEEKCFNPYIHPQLMAELSYNSLAFLEFVFLKVYL